MKQLKCAGPKQYSSGVCDNNKFVVWGKADSMKLVLICTECGTPYDDREAVDILESPTDSTPQ